MKKSFLFAAITFLSAFLMFQIELIISRIFLPRFGGSYLVWGACLVFFQCTLLAGYWFSQLVMQHIGIARYRPFHMLLLALPLVTFPGRGLGAVAARPGMPMVFDVFIQLLLTIGPVFFALSTSAVVFQSWLAASPLPEKRSPWVLYAVSNLGSFLALLSYPFLVEPFVSLSTQVVLWRLGYVCMLLLSLAVFSVVRTGGELSKPLKATQAPPLKDALPWFLLSAAGVVAFISVTNIITYEITPAPLLWIVPLCIYLISFVLNFKPVPYCPSWIKDKFHLTAGWAIVVFFLTLQRTMPIMVLFLAHALLLYSICMFCQHQLSLRKPAQAAALPFFYLILSLGGFAGGVTVTWIMPQITTSMLEYPLALVLIYLALSGRAIGEPIGFTNVRMIAYANMALIIWPVVVKKYNVFAVVLLFWLFYAVFERVRKSPKTILLICLTVLVVLPCIEPLWTKNMFVFIKRNYYGIYYVHDSRGIRFLNNGTTLHGGQFVAEEKALEALTYYHKDGPIGTLLTAEAFDFRRVGIVGLGVGGLAGYGTEGQTIDFYELDPDIESIARTFFSYVRKSPAEVKVIIGDARINLEKAAGTDYDLIVIDAFSGDSIPIHLLTTEAIEIYRRRLAPTGMILFHVSNRYLDLVPVLYSNASVLGAQAVMVKSEFNRDYPPACASLWVILTWNRDALRTLVDDLDWKREYARPVKLVRPWSDDFANILAVLRTRVFLDSIRLFQPFRW